jgi:imidazolonepropionase-like amidohydrolase
VNSIEHGEMSYQAPDVLEIMAANGTILVPTLSVFDKIADSQGQFPDWMVEQAKRLRESAYQTVAAALRAGVALAMGADTGPHGKNAQELVKMVEAGLSPMEGIVAATSAAARACRLQETIGTVTPGKIADLLVVDGDPIEDVRLFLQPEKVWLVLQNGNAVAGTRRRSGFNC